MKTKCIPGGPLPLLRVRISLSGSTSAERTLSRCMTQTEGRWGRAIKRKRIWEGRLIKRKWI